MEQKPVIIRHVWAENFEYEFSLMEKAIPLHPFISFDTEYPGTVIQFDSHKKYPISSAPPHYIYTLMKLNLDVLKIVQLGITLSDSDGNLPNFATDFSYAWQFNFRDFEIEHDRYNKDSIELLERQGIDFNKNREKGIDSRVFGARWISSSVMSKYRSSLTWITFHGGYDFALLIMILTGQKLPSSLDWFLKLVEFYFGYKVYDLKYMSYNHGLHGGLEKVANDLGVYRMSGNRHEAASDSLLTLEAFIRFMGIVYVNGSSFQYVNGCQGKLYGLCCKRMLLRYYKHVFYGGIVMPTAIGVEVVP